MLALEVVPLPVADVDRALAFYIEQAGFTLDVDYRPTPDFRVVQLTPPGSACSVHLVAADSHSRVHNLCLVTSDLEAERAKLIGRGVDVSAVRHKDPVETWAGGWSMGLDPQRMRSMTHRVFVYGTLKSGFWNHHLLEGCEFFGGAATLPTYKMIETGFPVIMPDRKGKPVAGEIYTVDDKTLARLDQLENEGRSYDRKLIDVTLPLASGERLPSKAFIYVGREDRFGKAFARGPLYETVNERRELDWKVGA